jgi:alpha-beta hydrolase superfamily lysophospholipase
LVARVTVGEHRFLVRGRIPVLKLHVEPRPRPAVVVLHGLGAAAEGNRGELISLAEAGFAAAGVDAPHHGLRRDGWLDELGTLENPSSHERFLGLLLEAIPEVSQVIDHLVDEGHWPIGLLGISMGAYTALGVARADSRVAATASLLGSPDWRPTRGEPTEAARTAMRAAPVHDPDALTRAPLLLLNAGRDTDVLPDAARTFARRHAVEYVEYPESAHEMRPDDWADAWRRAVGFLARHLAG